MSQSDSVISPKHYESDADFIRSWCRIVRGKDALPPTYEFEPELTLRDIYQRECVANTRLEIGEIRDARKRRNYHLLRRIRWSDLTFKAFCMPERRTHAFSEIDRIRLQLYSAEELQRVVTIVGCHDWDVSVTNEYIQQFTESVKLSVLNILFPVRVLREVYKDKSLPAYTYLS